MLSVSSFSTFSSVNIERNVFKDINYIFTMDGGTMFITLISSSYSDAMMF